MNAGILPHINAGQVEAKNINCLEKFSQVPTYQGFTMMFDKRIINDLQVFFKFLSCVVRRCLLLLQLSQGLADTRLDIVRNDFSSFIADRKVGLRRQFFLSSVSQSLTVSCKVAFFKVKQGLNQLGLDIVESTAVRLIFPINRLVSR